MRSRFKNLLALFKPMSSDTLSQVQQITCSPNINERTGDSSDKDDVEKEVVYLAKNFRKFLKMKNNGKSFGKGKFPSPKNDKRDFKKKDWKDSSSSQGIVCYECNGHGHLKKECPNYLRGKGKVLTTTLSDLESSNSNVEG